MKAIQLPESHVSLAHFANVDSRKKRCMKLIERLTFMQNDLVRPLIYQLQKAKLAPELREYCINSAISVSDRMKDLDSRINRLTNYFNSLIII